MFLIKALVIAMIGVPPTLTLADKTCGVPLVVNAA
jgi:hypothetical protein